MPVARRLSHSAFLVYANTESSTYPKRLAMNRIRITSVLMLFLATGLAVAQEKGAMAKDVLGLFHKRCIKCHGADKPKAGLNLTSLETLGRGGKRGHVVVPRKPDDSLLWQVINEEKMPPKEPLPEAERALLK